MTLFFQTHWEIKALLRIESERKTEREAVMNPWCPGFPQARHRRDDVCEFSSQHPASAQEGKFSRPITNEKREESTATVTTDLAQATGLGKASTCEKLNFSVP